MIATKMSFDMETGERLKVARKYVKVYQTDGGIRYYNLNGKLLNALSKEQAEEVLPANWISTENWILTKKGEYWNVLTYEGEEICKFIATDLKVYKNYIILKDEEKSKLYDVEKRKFLGGTFKKILCWDEIFVLLGEKNNYLYSTKKQKIEAKFQAYISIKKSRGEEYLLIYNNNRCGLWYKKRCPEKFFKVLPMNYQKIKVLGKEIQAIKDGKAEYYSLDLTTKANQEEKNYVSKNNENVEDNFSCSTKFINKIQVNFGEEVTLKEKFIVLLGDLKDKKPCKYYTHQGKYIGESGIVKDEFGEFCAKNYIETENILILGGEESSPFGMTEEWNIYDYEGNQIFKNSFKTIKPIEEYLICMQQNENQQNKSVIAIFSNKGKLLCRFNNVQKILKVATDYFQIVDYENRIWVLDNKGKAIFDRGIEISKSTKYEDFIFEKIENGYNIFNCKYKKVYYVEADTIDVEDILELKEKYILKVSHKRKVGAIMLNEEGCKKIIPTEYSDVDRYGDFMFAKTEKWDDIYDYNGTLILSTK